MIIQNPLMINKLKKELDSLPLSTIFAFDVETTGVNTRKDKIIGLGIAWNGKEVYFDGSDMSRLGAHLLKDKKLVGWNSYFDLEMIKNNYNLDLWQYLHADVLMMKHTLDEEPPFKLKDVAVKHFGKSAKDDQQDLHQSIKDNGGAKNEFSKADPLILAKYCMKDCNLTLRLYNKFQVGLRSEGLHNFFYIDEVMPLYKEVTRFMQSRGVQVDIPKIIKAKSEITLDIMVLEQSIYNKISELTKLFKKWYYNKHFPVSTKGSFAQAIIELSGLPIPKTASGKYSISVKNLSYFNDNKYISFLTGEGVLDDEEIEKAQNILANKIEGNLFNINSKDNLRHLFFNILNEDPVSKTKGGKPQVNDEFLELMSHKYEWCKTLTDYNKLCKLSSTYIERILEAQEDGKFYPTFKQHGTISGRYSGDLQQLPRVAEFGEVSEIVRKYRNRIREFFIAGSDCRIVDADYESLEPHIFAHVSNEESIRNIFHKGHDFYSTIAIDTENLTDVSADKQAENYMGKLNKIGRQRAKAYSLGIPYGMESWKLSKSLNIVQEDAERLINNYLNAYPNLGKWMKNTHEKVLRDGKITTQLGRVRRFPQLKFMAMQWNLKELENSLDVWKMYHEDDITYGRAKAARRIYKNALNNAKNFQIQSLAASIVNRASIAISRALKQNNLDAYICMQIHDQIVVSCEEKDVDLVKKIVQHNMENVVELSVKLKAPAEVGTNFADAH